MVGVLGLAQAVRRIAAARVMMCFGMILCCVEADARVGEPFGDVGGGGGGVLHHEIHVLGHVMRLYELCPTLESLGAEFCFALVAG